MRKFSRLLIGSLTLLVSLQGEAATWLLGNASLGFRRDVDVMTVGRCPSAANRPVRAVLVRVSRREANIQSLQLRMGNNQWVTLNVRQRFPAGSQSRWIDLPGGRRCIEQIRVVGQTDSRFPFPFGAQSVVSIYGAD